MIWIGDDWAEDHHDVEILDQDGRRLARTRLPEGLEGITRLHTLIAEHLPRSWADLDPVQASGQIGIGIETDRGTWVQALLAAGYQVYAINPMSSARCPRPVNDPHRRPFTAPLMARVLPVDGQISPR